MESLPIDMLRDIDDWVLETLIWGREGLPAFLGVFVREQREWGGGVRRLQADKGGWEAVARLLLSGIGAERLLLLLHFPLPSQDWELPLLLEPALLPCLDIFSLQLAISKHSVGALGLTL